MTTLLHATCVALAGKGVLLLGPSGSGKSDLALRLVDGGARLVADDQVALAVRAGQVVAHAPAGLPRALEVRGLGLVRVPMAARAAVAVVFDLAGSPIERLPEPDVWTFGGVTLPRFHLEPFAASAAARVRLAAAAAVLPVEIAL